MTAPHSSADLPPSPVHWAAVEEWLPEGSIAHDARARMQAEGSAHLPTRAQGAALALLARLIDAQHVLVLGSTGGVSEAWLMDGMAATGTVTVIDPDHHRQALTKDALAEYPSGSVRVISGQAAEVVPRLADCSYDLIVCDEAAAVAGDAQSAPRLLRPGGVLVLRLSEHDGSRSLRDVAASLREDPRWTTAWLTTGNGLLVSVWQGYRDEVFDEARDEVTGESGPASV